MSSEKEREKQKEKEEPSQGDGDPAPPPPPPPPLPGPPDLLRTHGNSVFKSGPLFLSSKGIGWKSWKKRWFILTLTSLVFFRSDPSAVPQKVGEVNLTLGGIDLNNSGSVVVKADRELLTVLFADGHDGRTFTLKAETLEDLYEWKTALESALAQASSAALVNGIFKNDHGDVIDVSKEKLKDRQPIKSTVIGRPILLALEDVDGAPSFVEKALRFIEEHEVERLQEQLQQERDKRTALELGLGCKRTALELGLDTSQQPRQIPCSIDEKTKAQLEETAEADVINLKQKVDDLGTQLNQQQGQDHGSTSDSCTWNPPGKGKDKQKDHEDTTTLHHVMRSASEDNHVDGPDIGNKEQESTSLPNKHPQQNQQTNSVCKTPANSSAGKQVLGRPNASNSKRYGKRSEGTNSTTYALSKLTTRLNFLKERRS